MGNYHGSTIALKVAWLQHLTDVRSKAALYYSNKEIGPHISHYTPRGEVKGKGYPAGGVYVGPSSISVYENTAIWKPNEDIKFPKMTIDQPFDTVLIYTHACTITVHTFGEQTLFNEEFILRIPEKGLLRITDNYK